ncbi:hypothetical protein ACW0JT_02360 [Arthrobacter sp. SA17]
MIHILGMVIPHCGRLRQHFASQPAFRNETNNVAASRSASPGVNQGMNKEHLQLKNVQDATALTATVGARQFGKLKHEWSEYCSITDPRNGPIDPVEALHRTGTLLNAVGDVIISANSINQVSPETPTASRKAGSAVI